ncbi:hypothetical protein DBB29_00040 [Pandoraea cepalis]|uniref:Uncharacterized protein n=1 Tax=Pandoraea cepalis TaxID=2508294 RepID=A0AAW7MG22_9BURK|nr:hypothetical protein [Pandoraea cepalis]MDN4571677.1 hypothetical protein [Pandoraea cepalis]MDN4576530.1 hypothetical protein [Pandoraea cepalis]
MAVEIDRLLPLDVTSDEVRIFHVVEWVDTVGRWFVDVFPELGSRNECARAAADAGAKRVAVYEMYTPFVCDLDGARDYATDHQRCMEERGTIH